MSVDKLNENGFDRILSSALRKHTEKTPDGFTEKITALLIQQQQQKILARVIMQERLALAACIILPAVTIVVLIAFPAISSAFLERFGSLTSVLAKQITAATANWHLWAVFAAVFGYAVFSLVDLLCGEA